MSSSVATSGMITLCIMHCQSLQHVRVICLAMCEKRRRQCYSGYAGQHENVFVADTFFVNWRYIVTSSLGRKDVSSSPRRRPCCLRNIPTAHFTALYRLVVLSVKSNIGCVVSFTNSSNSIVTNSKNMHIVLICWIIKVNDNNTRGFWCTCLIWHSLGIINIVVDQSHLTNISWLKIGKVHTAVRDIVILVYGSYIDCT